MVPEIRLRAPAWRALLELLGRGAYRVVLEGTAAELAAVDRGLIDEVARQVGAELELDQVVDQDPVSPLPPFPALNPRAELEDLILAGSWGVDRDRLLEQCLALIQGRGQGEDHAS